MQALIGRLRSTEQENKQSRILREFKLETVFQAVDLLPHQVMGAGSDLYGYQSGALFLRKDEGLVMCHSGKRLS